MKNITNIYSDEVCVYISVEVTNRLYGMIALLIADIIIITVLIIAVIAWIPALLLISAALLFMVGKYTLWNLYGKEHVIINTKSVSYQHDYGFFKTGYTVKSFNKALNLHVGPVKPVEDKNLLVKFTSYDDNDLPIEVYTMALGITDEEALQLNTLIKQLFVDKVTDEYMLPHIHLN